MCHLGDTSLVFRTLVDLKVFDVYIGMLSDDDTKLL